MDILRQKIQADKKLLVAANMELTETEATRFWPVYDAYQADLGKINARTAQLIKDYAAQYNAKSLTDDVAQRLMQEALAIEQAEVTAKQAAMAKASAALPATKAARYMQIENKIRAVIKFELADGIPLVP
jgi:chorismate mutase